MRIRTDHTRASLIALAVLAFASCSKPCADSNCGPGYCSDGTCICPDGYYGNHCQYGGPAGSGQDPIGFRIDSITISNVPQCWSTGTPIDGSSEPDLYVEIHQGSSTWYTGVASNATQASFGPFNWVFHDLTQNCFLKVYDVDGAAPPYQLDLMVNIGFNGQTLMDEPDNAFSTQIQNNFSSDCYPYGNPSWVRVWFELLY